MDLDPVLHYYFLGWFVAGWVNPPNQPSGGWMALRANLGTFFLTISGPSSSIVASSAPVKVLFPLPFCCDVP